MARPNAAVVAAVLGVLAVEIPVPLATERPVQAYIGLGANLGDARAAVTQAISRIALLPETRLQRQSSLYQSAPVDAGGADYINAVVEVETRIPALELLHALQNLEQLAGRQRPYRNAPRTLDLDLLIYGDLRLETSELTIPHPRMWQRAFVLRPLTQVAPGRVTAAQLDSVKDQRTVVIDSDC